MSRWAFVTTVSWNGLSSQSRGLRYVRTKLTNKLKQPRRTPQNASDETEQNHTNSGFYRLLRHPARKRIRSILTTCRDIDEKTFRH